MQIFILGCCTASNVIACIAQSKLKRLFCPRVSSFENGEENCAKSCLWDGLYGAKLGVGLQFVNDDYFTLRNTDAPVGKCGLSTIFFSGVKKQESVLFLCRCAGLTQRWFFASWKLFEVEKFGFSGSLKLWPFSQTNRFCCKRLHRVTSFSER